MCCGIPVHYQFGILNFYPSRSYGIYEFDVAEDDSSTSPPRISGRFLYNGHPVAYQITATGEQVTSCYNIGNGPRPSRTPLALGFCGSYSIYEFDVAEDDSSIFLPSVFDGCTIVPSALMGRYRPLWLPLT
ncbi:hypothetical protein T06_14174 [Trichinella sp. T6]|nr:hypothetical protein T06_14174 [Trichinella sp. T6]